MAGDLQAQLVGAGGQDELAERGHLPFPAESSDPPVREPAHPPPDLGEFREVPPLGREQDLVGDVVDLARAEERRSVPRRGP